MRAVIYARVSSDKQRERDTIASQLSTLPKFVIERGWTLVQPANTYVDDGRTAKAGHLDEREAFQRLMRDAQAGLFEVVVVVDLDRLTRSEDLTERGQVYGLFQRAGVQIAVASTGQVLDLRSSMGDLMSTLGAFFAAEENRKRRERTVRGRLEAARRNRPSSLPPWGLTFDRATNTWGIDEEVAELIREMFRRVAAGESTERIAADMHRRGVQRRRSKKWHRERVYALVRATVYRGEWVVNKEKPAHGRARAGAGSVTIKVPAIIDDELFYAAQNALARARLRGLRKRKHIALLEEVGVCGLCGAPIHIKQTDTRFRYYVCSRRYRRAFGERCELPNRRIDETDAKVWARLSAALARPDLIESALAERTGAADDEARAWLADLKEYETKLARLDAAQATIIERFRRGLVGERVMDTELERAARERKLLEQQVATARERCAGTSVDQAAVADLEAALKLLRERLADADDATKREVVLAFVAATGAPRVTFQPDVVELRVLLAAPGAPAESAVAFDVVA